MLQEDRFLVLKMMEPRLPICLNNTLGTSQRDYVYTYWEVVGGVCSAPALS